MTLIRAMTFNLFSPGPLEPGDEPIPGEIENSWERRAALNVRTVRRYSPDLIGLQEVDEEKLATYRESFGDYGLHANIGLPILWRASRFELLDSGTFWLSPTPDKPSTGWGVPEELGATWVRLRCKEDGAELVHLNTQFDDESELSRIESSRLVASRLGHLQTGGLPAVATGDFNCNPWHTPYRVFMDAGFVDTYRAAGHGDSAASSTFHGLQGERYFALDWGGETFWRVDWILTHDSAARRLSTTSGTIVRDAEPPVYPSDHYPVVSELWLE